MRVGIATVYTPGIRGGAEFLADGLAEAVRAAGHSLHLIRLPFFFDPPAAAGETMDRAAALDFSRYGGGQIDRLICLKFPAYLIDHPKKSVWLLHQHRSAYDLYGGRYGWQKGRADTDALRDRIIAADNAGLGDVPVYTIAARVSQRLNDFNGIASTPLYHPPADEHAFHCARALPYIFAPSRLEALKRQDLLLRAIAACRTPVQAIFAGAGSMQPQLERLAGELGIRDRVRFLGEISRAEMIELYANALGVFFGPLDEDYGYVTLEAMLSQKPVVTCTDSGGPLEFVIDGETGIVCAPEAQAVAAALEDLAADPARAAELGRAGRARYDTMGIGWDHVVSALLAEGA
ncbi:glycosyltransferase family 4 protein [Mesorhizobium sp. CAU 1741]|uniref:glycosyltransferase family 4 protein n=1 Tax=Mesorhizobium sp. CAU 1741 TaxID=3140366 RepID=UPI00325A5819